VRVTNCEFLAGGTKTDPSYGMDLGAGSLGVLIEGCTFEGWAYGIYSQGAALRQIGNWFGINIHAVWFWAQGSSTVANCSIGDVSVKTGQPLWSYPPNTGCVVIGPFYH